MPTDPSPRFLSTIQTSRNKYSNFPNVFIGLETLATYPTSVIFLLTSYLHTGGIFTGLRNFPSILFNLLIPDLFQPGHSGPDLYLTRGKLTFNALFTRIFLTSDYLVARPHIRVARACYRVARACYRVARAVEITRFFQLSGRPS